ncbi:MAG: long-chain fatty acid--CoA ligase [Acidiferrobacteraceae bacterium]|jgi:long-chain acyl-CoA synthetase
MRIRTDKDSTLSDAFIARVRASSDRVAYRQYREGEWVDYTWSQAADEVSRWQQAMVAEGLKPGDRISVCMRNRIEWVFFDQAALGLGLITVPLYFNDRPDNMAWCMNDAEVRLLVLEDDKLWSQLREHVNDVEKVVTLASPAVADDKVMALNDWLPGSPGELAKSPATGQEMATIVYTSGTTGRPKGVMLSHYNILFDLEGGLDTVDINESDRMVSFLPLSHTLERTVGYYMAVVSGAQTVFARGITELAEDIHTHQPTVLVSVPRIFERIYVRMQEGLPAGSFKRFLFEKAVDVGWRRFCKQATLMDRILWPLLKLLVARKLYKRLGGRLRIVLVGAAALSPTLARVFCGLGLPIIQGYGLTETSPIATVQTLEDNDPASVGYALPDTEVKLAEDGEILIRGDHIMLGYWENEAATRAVIDDDGWFHSGDLGEIRDGRVYITGRAKEMIVMSNGENVSPTDVEQAILSDPVFEQVMVVGEGRSRLALLVVSGLEDTRELCQRANRQLGNLPGWVRIHFLSRVPEPWTVENGFLTPTLKLKRAEVEQQFAQQIEAMYQGPELYSG